MSSFSSLNKTNIPTVLIVFGATGDLMAKKISPSLFHLFQYGKLPKMFQVLGVARRDLSDNDFRKHIHDVLKAKGEKDKMLNKFIEHFFYKQGEFQDKETYIKLSEVLGRTDKEWRVCSNKLFYLAVPPLHYKGIFENLSTSGLTIPCGPEEGWTRVIVEKPFGEDSKTARRLDKLLGSLFREEQIYRIDHYLAKEMLQNILIFRFTNNLLEKIWNHESVESINIKLYEKLGVETRGSFYETVGALRDVGQNHLLQMLALSIMENPLSFEAEAVRQQRAKALQSLPILKNSAITENTVRAQYKGYKLIAGVDNKSKVETYFKIFFSLSHKRWKGVKVILESGKRLGENRKEIIITLRHKTPCLCPPGQHLKNKIIFRMEPREEIKINFWSKKPGLDMNIQSADFDFIYQKEEKHSQYTKEYEKLLLDCIEGNQLLFVSTKEIGAMWKFTDPIEKYWEKNLVYLETYEPDSLPNFKKFSRLAEKENG